MSSTNKTTYYELSQYVGTDKPTYLGDYNSDMLKIDTAIHEAATDASTAVSTANTANSTATTASSNASSALSTANSALETATTANETAGTASTNASAALAAAEAAETAAAANTITNLAPAYDPTLTYDVGDLVTYIDEQGSGKIYKCIVAVSTPEAFNINKWDDVTASEAFAPKYTNYSVTADGVLTLKQIFDNLGSQITINTDNIYYLKIKTSSTTEIFIDNTFESNFIRFSNIRRFSGATCRIDDVVVSTNANSSFNQVTINPSTDNTVTNISDNVPTSGIIYEILEMIK